MFFNGTIQNIQILDADAFSFTLDRQLSDTEAFVTALTTLVTLAYLWLNMQALAVYALCSPCFSSFASMCCAFVSKRVNVFWISTVAKACLCLELIGWEYWSLSFQNMSMCVGMEREKDGGSKDMYVSKILFCHTFVVDHNVNANCITLAMDSYCNTFTIVWLCHLANTVVVFFSQPSYVHLHVLVWLLL